MTDTHTDDEGHRHDRGLAYDLPRLVDRRLVDRQLVDRRRALRLLAGAGLVTVAAACGGKSTSSSSATSGPSATTTSSDSSSSSSSPSTTGSNVTEIADETAGPFPGDGSNGPNVLSESGVVRGDIRSSIGSLSGTAEGVLLTVTLTVLDINNGAAALPGAAVYLWQCDRDGNYSMYSITDQNYLRGVQVAGDDGKLTFTSVFPGCYPGRWPHLHFEVYGSLDAATSGGTKLKTSQLAFPEDSCKAAYAADGYDASVDALSGLSLETDGVFGDGWSTELATVTGNAADGFTATLTVGV